MNITKCLLGAIILLTSFAAAACMAESVNYKKAAEIAAWSWQSASVDPFYCIGQSQPGYGLRMEVDTNQRSFIQFTILAKDKELISWRGHRHTVFRILNDRLYYADYPVNDCGGMIVCVDLANGKELWRSNLLAVGNVDHSGYANLISLDVNNEVVTVLGNEGAGRYIEFKSVKDGQTVGHKVFPKDVAAEKK